MSTPASSSTASPPGRAVDDSVKHLHLIDAMRTNDIPTITAAVRRLADSAVTPSYGSPLHLAISLCSTPVVEHLVATFGDALKTWVNARSLPDGETPLHVAAKLGRADVVEVIFKIKGLDDTIRDADGRTAEEVAKSERIAGLVVAHKTQYAEKILSTVRQHLHNNATQAAIDVFKNDARANAYLSMGWIDINAPIDPETEHSFLHFAAKADDVQLLNWALERGADPGVKDRKGKKPVDLCPKKDSQTKEKLKTAIAQAPIMSGSLPQATSSTSGAHNPQAPTLRGTLFKWTNYAVGYKNRYFVLEHGNLSYYKSSTDYPLACRGSISTMIANVVLPDSSDKSRFDVIGKGSVRYSLKARSPADAKKWVWALMESKKYMIDRAKDASGDTSRTSLEEKEGSEEWEQESSSGEELAPSARLSVATDLASSGNNLNVPGEEGPLGSARSSVSGDGDRHYPASVHTTRTAQDALPTTSTQDIGTLMYLLNVQLDVQQRVVEALVDALAVHSSTLSSTTDPSAGGPVSSNNSFLQEVDVSNLPSLLQSSSKHVQDTVRKLVERCEQRQRHWARRWKKEKESRRRWEEVVQKVLGIEGLPSGENNTMRVGHPVGASDTVSIATSGHGDADLEEEFLEAEDGDVFYDAIETDTSAAKTDTGYIENMFGFDAMDDSVEKPVLARRPTRTGTSTSLVLPSGHVISRKCLDKSLYGYPPTSSYRASLPLDPTTPKPSLAVWSFLKSAIGKDLSKVTLPVFFNEPLSMLQRMCEDIEYIELLSLASSVGRGFVPAEAGGAARAAAQTLGVSFDDLCRLDEEDASLVRIMYVGAYAMSNYSSTVGRVNKPFNPLLGETYELVREDKGFRYLSEQVCHHPPISACHCESPDYTFWTEVNVKSKFWGKSLEIHPLGMCHARLPVYTKATNPEDKANVSGMEHYSWKKVTTNVNNLIVGKLWIDHYGDMVIHNYRTGEDCIITFKPKNAGGGWFGLGGGSKKKDDANGDADNGGGEIVGIVKDANGVVKWELKGRWDDKVVAHFVGSPVGKPSLLTQPLPLWRRNPTPVNASQNFNFTAFACSLNQATPTLTSVLPPTDSRIRPDQQAMEKGQWDLANTCKEKLEELQRNRRKKIVAEFEKTGVPSGPSTDDGIPIGEAWWVPRWFVREVEEDGGEEHWRFNGEYWKWRERVQNGEAWPEWVLDVFGSRGGELV
ncbi:hypothetical protein SpCBS45565_g04523 [Spizellomyces sp. 'palustris']|nr:hypothetical protein SpCBS45565_g04523 [Spizellomyces sp. 'palustris']